MKKIISVIIGFGIIICTIWYFTNDNEPLVNENISSGNPAVKVIVQEIEITSNDRVFQAVGTGRAEVSIGIYSSVAEEVTEVLFTPGQEVKKGDLLVQLDDREEKLSLQLAEVEAVDANNLLERYNQAVKEGAVPESEVDAARATYDGAKVAAEQAKLALAERQIIAPFDGIVGLSNVDPGDRIGTDTLITGLDARDIIFVDFEVPEAIAGSLDTQSSDQKVIATTPAYNDRQFSGHIQALDSRINAERRTLMVRAAIENQNDLLRPGMSFETQWTIKGEDYPTVPEISVQWGREGSYIWIIRDNKAIKTEARVVARKSGRVLLESNDLREGDVVVIEGLQRLRPDQDVEILGSNS